jgi:hypothetical protein
VIIYPVIPFFPILVTQRQIDGAVIAGWCMMLLVGVFIVAQSRKQFRSAAERGMSDPMVRRLMDGVTIELKPDRILSSTKVSAGWYAWDVVSAIVRRGDRAFFWLGQSQAIVVPRRVFRSDDEFNRFVELACEYKYGKSTRTLCAKCSYDLRGNLGAKCPECGTDQNTLEFTR